MFDQIKPLGLRMAQPQGLSFYTVIILYREMFKNLLMKNYCTKGLLRMGHP